MDAALKAIAEPRRREILRLVWSRELPATEIAEHFGGVTRSAISQHLGVLKAAGLVNERREGTRRLYRARFPIRSMRPVDAYARTSATSSVRATTFEAPAGM